MTGTHSTHDSTIDMGCMYVVYSACALSIVFVHRSLFVYSYLDARDRTFLIVRLNAIEAESNMPLTSERPLVLIIQRSTLYINTYHKAHHCV